MILSTAICSAWRSIHGDHFQMRFWKWKGLLIRNRTHQQVQNPLCLDLVCGDAVLVCLLVYTSFATNVDHEESARRNIAMPNSLSSWTTDGRWGAPLTSRRRSLSLRSPGSRVERQQSCGKWYFSHHKHENKYIWCRVAQSPLQRMVMVWQGLMYGWDYQPTTINDSPSQNPNRTATQARLLWALALGILRWHVLNSSPSPLWMWVCFCLLVSIPPPPVVWACVGVGRVERLLFM